MELKISKGNSKLKKSKITAFSLPEGKTCPFKGACFRDNYCYSMKASRQYPNVKLAREHNYQATLQDDFIENAINSYSKINWKTHRIHADGDFYNQTYAMKWLEIIRSLPSHRFYAYTKSFLLFDYDMLPENFLLIQSLGGTQDKKIDFNRPHAKIFNSEKELIENGYHDCSKFDHEVFNAGNKIGLIFH